MIIKTRIKPRKRPENIVSRERLLKLLEENKSKNILLILSPAGYGKTTLAADFVNHYNKKYCWFHISEDLSDIYTFFEYTVHSLKTLSPEFGKDMLDMISAMRESMQISKDIKTISQNLSGTFINEFSESFSEDVYIVLDDYHHIKEKEWLDLVFNSFIDDFPENLHFIITSREKPTFNISRLETKRNLFTLNYSDLVFSEKEISSLVNDVYEIKDLSKETSDYLSRNAKGWVTGIHIIAKSLQNKNEEIDLKKINVPEDVYSYFANDIFNGLSKEIQEFLVSTSLLVDFTPEDCDKICDMKNSSDLLKQISDMNLFIESRLDGSYGYHSLFREFLSSKINEVLTEKRIDELRNKIADYYEASGNAEGAVDYLLQSESYDKAVKLLEDNFESLLLNSNYEKIWQWTQRFPSDLKKKFNIIVYIEAKILKQYFGKFEEAKTTFYEFIKTVTSDYDTWQFVDAHIEISTILLLNEKISEAHELLMGIEDKIHNDRNKAWLLRCMANTMNRSTGYTLEQVTTMLDKALLICEEKGFNDIRSSIFGILGRLYHEHMELNKALYYFESSLKTNKKNYYKVQIQSNLIIVLALLGKFDKAKENLDELAELIKHYPAYGFRRNFMRVETFFYSNLGDYDSSLESLNRLMLLEAENNFHSHNVFYYIYLAELYANMGSYTKATQYLGMAEKDTDKSNKSLKNEIEYHRTLLLKITGIGTNTEKSLLKCLKYSEKNNYIYTTVVLNFHLADYFYKHGQRNTALAYFTTFLDICSGKSYFQFPESVFTQYRYLFEFGLKNNIQSDFIRTVHQNCIDKLSLQWISPEFRKRLETEQNKLYDITLQTFGGVELFVRGEAVSDDKWLRKKSKLTMAYLLLHPEFKFTKDKIMDLFFRDLSVDSAENTFHQTITNLRNVTKFDLETNEEELKKKNKEDAKTVSSPYIIYEDKVLRLDPGYYYRVDALEFNKLYNIMKSSETDMKEKESAAQKAIDIYKGEFMSGIYEQWVEDMREVFTNRFTELCEYLITYYKKEKIYAKLIEYCDILLKFDKINEDAYLNVIEAYVSAGNTNMARNKFRTMLQNYETEYGEKPPKKTLDRINELLP